MRAYQVLRLVLLSIAILELSGCSGTPKTVKETSLDDMYPVLTEDEYDALSSIESDEEINQFLDYFWWQKDSIAGSMGNELRNEYLQRLEYANDHFPDRRGWGRSDRKRIYLVYGPPRTIDRYEFTGIKLGRLSTIKSLEIWSYFVPGKNTSLPSAADYVEKGEMRFVFGDLTGSGFYQILFSSEDGEDIDVRMFK